MVNRLSLFTAFLVLVIMAGFAFCATMNVHHEVMPDGGAANCSMAHFASVFLPPQTCSKNLAAVIVAFISILVLSLFYRNGDIALSSFYVPSMAADVGTVRNPFLEIMRRGIIHPKLYNFSFVP